MSTVYKEIMLLVLLTMKDRLKSTVLPRKKFFDKFLNHPKKDTHDRIKGILHPGTFWIGIRYENGKYYIASDQANQYHGYIRTKPDLRGPTIQCAYITIDKFYTNQENKIIEANWKWGPCDPHRFFICEVQHDKVDYSMTPCPDCFYPDKEPVTRCRS